MPVGVAQKGPVSVGEGTCVCGSRDLFLTLGTCFDPTLVQRSRRDLCLCEKGPVSEGVAHERSAVTLSSNVL